MQIFFRLAPARAARGLLAGFSLALVAACDSSSGTGQALDDCDEPAGRACYNVSFTGLWNATDHPTEFPAGAHFSPMIGATHNAGTSLWRAGDFASAGIEDMAETGRTSTLRTEIDSRIANSNAQSAVRGDGIGAQGSVTFSFRVSEAFPLLTLTSMIAPSPDWFVGIDSVSLRENGDWVARLERDLHAYDAGTDDGVAFTSPNADSNPQDAIARLLDTPFTPPIAPLGRLVIERVL